jgi:Tol biopolymer transport system component
MPEVEEVFRLATNKVKPDPNALERQQRRQRSAARSSRVRVYLAVAAVIAAVAAGAVVVLEAAQSNEKTSVDNGDGSGTPGQLTFAEALPAGAIEQELDIVDLQGRTTSTVPGLPLDGFAPSVSADGSTIAFVAVPNEMAYNQIGIMNADGSDPHFVPTPGVVVSTVAVSPDGSRIAFEGLASGNGDIYVVRSDGSGLRQLTDDPATDQFPQWSPDGTTIVYDNAGAREEADAQYSPTAEIWTTAADGSGSQTRLTTNDVADSSPAFSSDGTRIAFYRNGSLWTMSATGSNQRWLAWDGAGGWTPRWSPDGTRIAFTYYRSNYRPIVQLGQDYSDMPLVVLALVEVDSGRVARLTNVAMATDLTTPQWMDSGHILALRVPAKDPTP